MLKIDPKKIELSQKNRT